MINGPTPFPSPRQPWQSFDLAKYSMPCGRDTFGLLSGLNPAPSSGILSARGDVMTTATQQLLSRSLRLKPVERAELIEELFHSFDKSNTRRVDAAWAEEIESRIDAHDAGKISAATAVSVLSRINKR